MTDSFLQEHITHEEQSLLLLEAMIPAGENFYIWCFGKQGNYLYSSCPETLRPLLERAFRLFGGIEKAQVIAQGESVYPHLIGSPIGMQWAVTFETKRTRDLIFGAGPVFYSDPDEKMLREALQPYTSDPENAQWVRSVLRNLDALPVIPYTIFTRYVMMMHNTLTGHQLDISVLLTPTDPQPGFRPQAPEKRDRTKVYLAERAMLSMVRNGDINYQSALTQSSQMSPGVPVRGKDPLQQARVSIIVFTSLVCRAAMEGGLSPEIAYPLGDSYIEAAINSRDTGELNALAMSMYHDFIYQVHQLHRNPDYSPAIQKCCDYIEFSLDRPISIHALAVLTGYTDYYLTNKFKKETGVPLFLYIRNAKIDRAKLLLETTDLSVRDISDRLAFSSPNYFIKCFHELTGDSPAQYRQKQKKRK